MTDHAQHSRADRTIWEYMCNTFRRYIDESLLEGRDCLGETKKYISHGLLKKHWTENSIKHILQSTGTHTHAASSIAKAYTITLSIIVYTSENDSGRLSWLHDFQAHEYSDHNLPLRDRPPWISNNPQGDRFWVDFDEYQWMFVPAKLGKSELWNRNLDYRTIIPARTHGLLGNPSQGGGSNKASSVTCLQVDDATMQDDQMSSTVKPGGIIVLKSHTDLDAYKSEIAAYLHHDDHRESNEAYREPFHILKCFGSFSNLVPDTRNVARDAEVREYHVLLEFADRGTLLDLYKQSPPQSLESIKDFWCSVTSFLPGLAQIHGDNSGTVSNQPVSVHQDLKPSNIFICSKGGKQYDFASKLGDFDLSHTYINDPSNPRPGPDNGGTWTYCPPEMYLRDKYPHKVETALDRWAAACILLEACPWVVGGNDERLAFSRRRCDEIKGHATRLYRSGQADGFHNGSALLDCVLKLRTLVENRRQRHDFITLRIVNYLLNVLNDSILSKNPSRRPPATILLADIESLIDAASSQPTTLSKHIPGTTFYPGSDLISTPLSFPLPHGARNTSTIDGSRYPSPPFTSPVDASVPFGSEPSHGYDSFDLMDTPPVSMPTPGSFHPSSPSAQFPRPPSNHHKNEWPPSDPRFPHAPGGVGGSNLGWSATDLGPTPAPRPHKLTQSDSFPGTDSHDNSRNAQEAVLAYLWSSASSEPHTPSMLIPSAPPGPFNTDNSVQIDFPQPISSTMSQYHHSFLNESSHAFPTGPDVYSNNRPQYLDISHERPTPGESSLSIATSGPVMQSATTTVAETASERASSQQRQIVTLSMLEKYKKKRKNNDPTASLPYMDRYFHKLESREHIIVVDNSRSMQPRKPEVMRFTRAVGWFLKLADKNGLDVMLTSGRNTKLTKTRNTAEMMDHIEKHFASGADLNCDVEDALNNLVDAITHRLPDKRPSFSIHRTFSSRRPLSIYFLTDGIWDPESRSVACNAEHSIETLKERMRARNSSRTDVSIQLIRFGSDPLGMRRLQFLDDKTAPDGKDIVDHKASTDDIWKVLIGPLDGQNDDEPGGAG